MSFDAPPVRPQRVAIIGGGISGLAAAYLLSPQHRVALYEAEPRLGGHSRTVMAGRNGDRPVDTGFIVFNYANYPHLTRMFHDLDVPVARSDMSFGATIDCGRIEYGLNTLTALVGQRRNMLRPPFLRMVRDILRFNARAEAAASDDSMTVGELVGHMGLGTWFEHYYLMPICGAIWSTPPQGIRDFPARALIQFFSNHALLSPRQKHQWWTVEGGSIEYVRRLERHLRSRACILRPGTPVLSVARDEAGVIVHTRAGLPERFDQVIFACHSDQALSLLGKPTTAERAVLDAIRYQDNTVVLHSDPGQMPKRKACWSAWVYKADGEVERQAIGVTYWMNRLQNIQEDDPLFVSLNPTDAIPDDRIYDEKVFRHPVFNAGAIRAQKTLHTIQGQNNTWFAGAYTRHGFHEDGFASAVRIARQLNRQFA